MHVMPLAFSWEALEAVGTNGCGQEAHPLEMIFGHLRNCHSITLPSCSPLCLGHALLLCFPKGLGPTLKAKQMYRAGTRYAVCPVVCKVAHPLLILGSTINATPLNQDVVQTLLHCLSDYGNI